MTPVEVISKPAKIIIDVYEIPQEPELYQVEVDVPRNINEFVIKDDQNCRELKNKRNDENEIPKECLENPVIENTNIYVGFDLDNWEKFQINLFRIREYTNTLKEIIKEMNRRILEIKESQGE
ncbi:MAG: hypothetical protein QXF12_01515 [Candidatus Aenigmatarchaeota archaeon]